MPKLLANISWPHLLERWPGEWRAKGDLTFPGIGRRGTSLPTVDDARRIGELERKIGQLTMEKDFWKNEVAGFRGASSASRRRWRRCLFEEVRQAAAKGHAVRALCQMTGLNRARLYRSRLPRPVLPVEMEIRDAMQKIAVEFPAYGYPRMTAELRKKGFDINRKWVLRMMREDNLLCMRRGNSWWPPIRDTICQVCACHVRVSTSSAYIPSLTPWAII
jgi:HTH-like domain